MFKMMQNGAFQMTLRKRSRPYLI